MQFNITIDQSPFALEVADGIMQEAKEFIADMDAELDKGIQLGRHWLDNPSDEQKCQIAANKVVNAMHQENIRMVYLMAAYILTKMPDLKMVTVNSDYEIDEIDFI